MLWVQNSFTILYMLYTAWGSIIVRLSIFPLHILFIAIYLSLDYKLIHNNNSVQRIIMGNFLEATEYGAHTFEKFWDLILYRFL
jgi:hypothetical protein